MTAQPTDAERDRARQLIDEAIDEAPLEWTAKEVAEEVAWKMSLGRIVPRKDGPGRCPPRWLRALANIRFSLRRGTC